MSYADPSVAIELTGRARRRRLLRKRFLRRPFAVTGLVVAARVHRRSRSSRRWIAPYRPGRRATSTRPLAHPSRAAPARHRRARPRRLLAPRLGLARLDPGGRVRDAARDGDRGPDRPRRRLLPRLDRPGDRAPHRRAARVPVPDRRGRPRGDPRRLAPQRDDRPRHRSDARADPRRRAARRSRCARRTTCAPRSRTARATRASSASTSSRTCCSTLIVQATVTIPAAIIGEAVLSFLGLGVQSPQTSWGVMLSDAKDYLDDGAAARPLPRPRDLLLLAVVQPARRRPARRPRSADDAVAPCRCSRSTGSASGSRPTTASSRRSTACRSRSTSARCSASSASPAAGRASA